MNYHQSKENVPYCKVFGTHNVGSKDFHMCKVFGNNDFLGKVFVSMAFVGFPLLRLFEYTF